MCYINLLKVLDNVSATPTLRECRRVLLKPVNSPSVSRFPPDGLLTSEQTKHDVEPNSLVIAPDPFASDDCLDDLSPFHLLLLNSPEKLNTMNPGSDELSSGLNGRLRPRKSNIPSPQTTKSLRRSSGKTGHDKVKRTSTLSKTPPNKQDDLATKSDTTFLCPYCDRKFASKQSLSKHIRRIHGSSSKQDNSFACLFCSHADAESGDIVRHMAELHPQQYFACLKCHARFPAPSELAEHKIKSCDLRLPYRSKLRQKATHKIDVKNKFAKDSNVFSDAHGFNGVVISCELKPSQGSDGADIEDNITTNLILPPSKNLGSNTVVEKNAVIVLDDIHWNKRIPPNFSFHNTDADQILSRLGVVHRSPRTGEPSKKDWKSIDDSTQKFEKCFDTSFYSKVASNVQENISKFLDGSFNFNPDPDSTIKTRKSKNSVVINTAEGFPILLASDQYSRNEFDRYMPRAVAPKHKWKWDNLETEKSPINPDQIKRDSHTNNCIITLVSSLDIWTQLRMRRKFEEKFGCPPLEKKTEKQTMISNELKDILESRELPASSPPVVKVVNKARASVTGAEFPACLGLAPATPRLEPSQAVLSGEWVRPRCYVCCACGAQNRDSRAACAHGSAHHPNAQVQHYEIVGEQLLNADILKHLYVPPNQMSNRTRPLRGIRECTKCKKSVTLEDLHQHMLDCAGDTPAVRRKCRYRPFGVRRRRPRLPDNTIRKKIRKDIRTRQTRPKSLMRPRPIRTEVGDAETIRKMIADLPAKRHRVLVNPTNPSLRPRIKQRPKLLIKSLSSQDHNKRKKRNNKETAGTRSDSPPTNDDMSSKSDEDKPLKPKIKRIVRKAARPIETDKTKTKRLKRPKRKIIQAKDHQKTDNINDALNPNCSSKGVMTDVSLENSPKKIDVQATDFKAREHVGRGNSSNRDGQQPGCSGENENSQNRCAPVQNVPLKHSIARLTADSEKQDKSVQFHHLFLVQQECNNVNQHVNSGQQLLFENDPAVLTLDKPPLHCNSTTASLDACTSQKNKLNKPRKGLNACIAMLKNKLVEPAVSASIPTGHVSVQCGDDEPLYIKTDTALPTPVCSEPSVEVAKSEQLRETVPSKKTAMEPKRRRAVSKEKKCLNADADSTGKQSTNSCQEVAPKQKSQNVVAKRESSRRRALANEAKVAVATSKCDLITQREASELASSKPDPSNNIPIVADILTHKGISQQNEEPKTSVPQANNVCNAKDEDHVKSIEKQHLDQHLSEHHSLSVQEKECVGPIINPQTSTEVNESVKQGQSSDYYDNCLNLQPQPDFHLECEYNRKMLSENYPGTDLNHMPVNIRPAHASTNVESILSIPLDLSGKTSMNNSQDFSNHENAYLLRNSYDMYETLDLSNKNQELYRPDINLTISDEIVDLSIKTSQPKSSEVDATVKSIVTDLSLPNVNNDVPTDLSVKKSSNKISSNELEIKKDNVNTRALPLSKVMRNLDIPVQGRSQSEIGYKNLTVVSANDSKTNSVTLSARGPENQPAEKGLRSGSAALHQFNIVTPVKAIEKTVEIIPADLRKEPKPSDRVSEHVSSDMPSMISQVPESASKKIRELKSNQEQNSQIKHLRASEKPLPIQKPVYDPTLKIPQYKIRAAPKNDVPASTEIPLNTITSLVTVTPPSTCGIIPNITAAAAIVSQDVFAMTPVGKPLMGIQESTFSYGSAQQSVPNSNTASMFTVTNASRPSQLGKFESTTPVYTLANACISVTKIETSNSTTLTNTLLSIPGSTIANTTPVYTLAGTTIGVPAKYSHLVPECPSSVKGVKDTVDLISVIENHDERHIESTCGEHSDLKKKNNVSNELSNDANNSFNVDHDPETARKIALLPKELVDILGNMPVDHRNQLLNVLPQYVSTATTVPDLQSDLTNNSELLDEVKTSPTIEQHEATLPNIGDSMQEPETNSKSSHYIEEQDIQVCPSKSVTLIHSENTSSLTSLHPSTLETPIPNILNDDVKSQESSTTQQLRNSKEEPQIETVNVKSDLISEESFATVSLSRLPLCRDYSTNKVIDLTEDESTPRTEMRNEPPVEVSTHISVLVQQPKRNKTNNDQTASLRAVRIKAPSERQRSVDNQLVKQSTLTPVVPTRLNDDQDNEAKKSLHVNVSLNTDISLAIQQAEVSSTQHSNKNAIPECKFPSAISPNVQESNVEEINNCSLTLMSTPSKDEIVKNDDMQNIPLKSVAKSTLVTSSIVNNISKKSTKAMDKTCDLLNNDFASTKYISKSNVISSESDDSNKKESGSFTESRVQSVLDISESYELDAPIRCSTPNIKSLLDSQNERVLNEINHSCSNTCEEQEDSDDNISLAVICKQKQQNLQKDQIQNENATQKKSTTVRKRVKKNKKRSGNDNQRSVSLREESICNNNILLPIMSHKNNEQTTLTDLSDVSSKCTENDVQSKSSTIDQSSKKKVSKMRNSIVIINKVLNSDEKILNITPKVCSLHDKTSEISTVVEASENEKSDDNAFALKDEEPIIHTTRKRFRGHDNTDITNDSNKSPSDKDLYKLVPLKQKSKKKRKIPDVPPEECDKANDEQKQEIASKLVKEIETKGGERAEIKPDMQEVVTEQNLTTKESATSDESSKVKNPENDLKDSDSRGLTDFPISLYSRPQEPESNSSPLRRSRRGKSLSNSVDEEDILHIDSSLETKTPLTKKQLIFSKLLLDEENNLKTSESVSEIKISIELSVPQDESKLVENVITSKNKSGKRKKLSHFNRKNKKKKLDNDSNRISCEEEISEFPLSQTKPSEVTSQIDNNHSKSYEHSSDQTVCEVSGFKSVNLTTGDTASSPEKDKSLVIATEKRKSSELLSAERLQSPQSKKTKPSKIGNIFDLKTSYNSLVNEDECCEQLDTDLEETKRDKNDKETRDYNVLFKTSADIAKSDFVSVSKSKVSKESELRVKTCYNMPVAAGRRTRSKSAVIPTAVYDPYDIDMDDMIEHAEPLRQRKISADQNSSCSTKQQDFTINEKPNAETSQSNERRDRSIELCSKNYTTDSDDSSKSDVPLNKYVEGKEKKNSLFVGSRSNLKNDALIDSSTEVSSTENQNSRNEKRDKLINEVCNSSVGVIPDQTEEQLRSEQFMESFGFFSERKPRKSNLLATKKISETFHIIANECDDMYFGFKERNPKRSVPNENRKSIDEDNTGKGTTRHRSPPSKKSTKRGRKKKTATVPFPRFCHICKKEFRRPDNFLRHQMTLLHVSKVSEVEMKVKTVTVHEEPNYLLAYKEHLDRIKAITDKITKRKKNSKSGPKVTPLSLEEILADVNKIVREQQLSQRGLSCDEELFLDCCELLKESHKKTEPVADTPSVAKNSDSLLCTSQSRNVGLDLLGKSGVDIKCDSKNDGDVDSITAKSILESEEVRNLENDLISGLKEAAHASNLKTDIVYQNSVNDEDTDQHQEFSDHFSSPAPTESHYDHLDNFEEPEELNIGKTKKYPEFKEKMYPDIEEIDMFEDKFDKIKRKCRSQAAAAKQTQHVVETNTSRKGRKKSDKKKGKKSSKKIHSNTVLTKGALKGFDGIKVSIPTSDINIAAIVSPLGTTHKKRKKGNSKKRRENKISESSSKYDSDHPANDSSASMKNVDVYEFMDNEDVELFEFRPSTLMERFKSISNKETPSTSKVVNPVAEEVENSSTSASDGDDFVYMSDDYVCSDDETENSLMSCDASNIKVVSDSKKLLTHIKRRDVVEKNAVMGKIFKNNAVRSEKKMPKSKETQKPKANLDQLFDSLLEDEPSSSMLNDESLPLKDEDTVVRISRNSSPNQSEPLLSKYEQQYNFKKNEQSLSGKENYASLKQKTLSSDNEEETSSLTDYGPSTSKISMKSLIGVHKSIRHRKRHSSSPVSTNKYDISLEKLQPALNKIEKTSLLQDDFIKYQTGASKIDEELKVKESPSFENRSPLRKLDDDTGIICDYNESYDQVSTADETGVARQRARRKCTVGKQNVLAETWSSESEPDGGPPRSHSAESLASGTTRKKKSKKKDGHQSSSRRGSRHISFRKQDIESRVSSSNRNTTTQVSGASSSGGVMENRSAGSTNVLAAKINEACSSAANAEGDANVPATLSASGSASTSCVAGPASDTGASAEGAATFLVPAEPAEAAPSGKGRFHTVFYWSPEGHEQQQQQQQQQQQLQQQHGWIVGDSHKKLVTMLAHAKGRKRNNDDKRHLVE